MVLRERRYTLADLREIEQRPENANKVFELINGEVREVNPPKPNQCLGPSLTNGSSGHPLPRCRSC